MRLVLLSDTHEKHDSVDVPDGDVLVHAGDFTMIGEPAKIVAFDKWLGKLPHQYKIIIPGNHDLLFEKNEPFARSLMPDVTLLIDEEIVIDGVKFYGMPWTPTFGYGWVYNADKSKMEEVVSKIPLDTDVLISHGPPKGILDKTLYGDLAGSLPLQDRIVTMHSKELTPDVVVFGHIHESYGHTTYPNQPNFFNASICNLSYQPVNKPFVVDI